MQVEGFCSQLCGYHDYFQVGEDIYKFAFIGNANQCLPSCAPILSDLNGDVGLDGSISILAHELTESLTDPTGKAWIDLSDMLEDADMCIWTYGSTLSANGITSICFPENVC